VRKIYHGGTESEEIGPEAALNLIFSVISVSPWYLSLNPFALARTILPLTFAGPEGI
jgi:hypothetical protein